MITYTSYYNTYKLVKVIYIYIYNKQQTTPFKNYTLSCEIFDPCCSFVKVNATSKSKWDKRLVLHKVYPNWYIYN